MPAADYQGGSSAPSASPGRSIFSIRRDQVHSMDSGSGGDGAAHEQEVEAFQQHVAELFHDLAAAGEEILSISWLRKLLDAFLACHEEFRAVLFSRRAAVARPPLDRIVTDYLERSVKALDVCNAVRDGIGQIRQWKTDLEIVLDALGCGGGEGQLRRARKALADLTVLMLDEKDAASGLGHSNHSFARTCRGCGGGDHHRSSPGRSPSGGHLRSLSWSVSRSWSAARQLQALGSNLAAPRGHEVVATGGLAVTVYTMASVLLFVMWVLVAAIPCQDRGLQMHLSVPRSFLWAGPVLALHERIAEESKKKERRSSVGLLNEIHQIEKLAHHLFDVIDGGEKEVEAKQEMEQLREVYGAMKEGLGPLERQVREVFRRLVRCRTEGLDCLSHITE